MLFIIKRLKIILSFDLDNTLINNKEGIIASFNYALDKFNLPKIKEPVIESMIGIPLEEMFRTVSEIDPSILASTFRKYYGRMGIYQSNLIKGVKGKLKELKSQNFILGVITSKKQEMAEKIIKYLKISDFFDYIIGETEERKAFGKLDPKLKEILSERYPNYKIVVIGDHPKDVLLSNNLNCPFIGVLTGNHSADQLKKNKDKDIIIINSIQDLTIDLIKLLFES